MGLPALQVTTTSAWASSLSVPEPWIRPVHRVCVEDVAAQLPVKLLRYSTFFWTRVNFTDKVLPVNVPTICVRSPSDGNEPATESYSMAVGRATAAPPQTSTRKTSSFAADRQTQSKSIATAASPPTELLKIL